MADGRHFENRYIAISQWTRSSAVAERPRDASCLSVVSFNIPTAQFFITSYCRFRFTSALNSVLLCPIVSGGVRPTPLGQTPLVHTPPLVCCRSCVVWGQDSASWVGQGQEYGLVSDFYKKYPPGSVLRCPTAAENGGYGQGGCVRGVDLSGA